MSFFYNLGNDNSKFRTDQNATKLNFIIDGEMVSQFLRLSKYEQFRVIEKHLELIKACKVFIHGENGFYGITATTTTPLDSGSSVSGEKSEEQQQLDT